MSSEHHLAAVLTAVGSPLEVQERPTPTPGPAELLVEVKSIALNPVDYMEQETGFHISHKSAILGSDVPGIIIASGSAVTDLLLKPGARKGLPDYGGMQQRVIVPATNAVALPDSISFNEGALLPMSVATAWMGCYTIGIPLNTAFTPADKQGMLVWCGASSIGTAAVQIAKSMGLIVYATASAKHHEDLKSLGATRVFDYEAAGVEQRIVTSAKEDGVTIRTGYDAVGQLQSCLDVTKEFKGERVAKLAEAVPMSEESPTVDGVVAKFIAVSSDVDKREEQYRFIFNVWLQEKLASGQFVPSPKVRVVDSGLQSVNQALDTLKNGVSGERLVLEI